MRAYYENRSYSSKLSTIVKVTKGFSFLAHWHTDVEMLSVLDGQIRIGVNQEVKLLSKGDLAICPSGKIHYYDSSNLSSDIIQLIFHPKVIGFPDGWPKDRNFPSPLITKGDSGEEVTDQIQKLLLSLYSENKKDEESSRFFVLSRLYEILGLAIRHFSVPVPSVPPGRDTARGAELSIVHHILRYIDERYMTNLTLETVADEFKVSPSYLSRLVKKTSEMSFISYLLNRRILRAEYLLRDSGKSITEIAFDCGFESIRTFNRVFRELNGASPTQYRKKQRNIE